MKIRSIYGCVDLDEIEKTVSLEVFMELLSDQEEYEKAAIVRDEIKSRVNPRTQPGTLPGRRFITITTPINVPGKPAR